MRGLRRVRRSAALLAGGALAAMGVQHLIWAFSYWPFATEAEAADHILGDLDSWPSAPATLGVGAALLAASYLPLAAARIVPEIGPSWICRLGKGALATVLFVRGFGGPFLLGPGATDTFVKWNWWLYSPLCVVLGLLVIVAAAPGATAAAPAPNHPAVR